MKTKKAQIGLNKAVVTIMIVGLLFLTMATIALVSNTFGESILTTEVTATIEGEDVTAEDFEGDGYTLTETRKNSRSYSIVALYNNTDELLLSGNYSLSERILTNETADIGLVNGKVNYTFLWTPETTAYNATSDLETEIGNNTSIAGMILTISLVGIVLTILIGVFIGIGSKNRI